MDIKGQPFSNPLVRIEETQVFNPNALATGTIYLTIPAIDPYLCCSKVQVTQRASDLIMNTLSWAATKMANRAIAFIRLGNNQCHISRIRNRLFCKTGSTKREIGFYTHSGHHWSPFFQIWLSTFWIKEKTDDVHFLLAA
jgi:hypothetical protein